MSIKDSAVRFFYEHAGFSYDPKTETKEQGHKRCARELAEAEHWIRDKEWGEVTIEWDVDENADHSGIDHKGPLFDCLITYKGESASLGSIDLGENGADDDYRRVVEAELAQDLMQRTK